MQAATKAQVSGIGGNGAVLVETASAAVEGRGQKVRAMLKARLGDEIYSSWFKSLEFESFDGRIVKVSVPVKFVRNWIQEHYADHLLACSRIEFATVERVDVIWRQPGSAAQRAGEARPAEAPATGTQLAQASPQAEIAAASTSVFASRRHRRSARRRAVLKDRRLIRATHSTASSSAPRTAWRTPARRRLPKR